MANLRDNFLALVDALNYVRPIGTEKDSPSERADRGYDPYQSETLAIVAGTAQQKELNCFGVTLDAVSVAGSFLTLDFGGGGSLTRVFAGQTVQWYRGARKLNVDASATGDYSVSWQIDRYAQKRGGI